MKTELQLAEEALLSVGHDRVPPRFIYCADRDHKDFSGRVVTRLFRHPKKEQLGRVIWSGRPHEVPFKVFGSVDFYASEPIILPPFRKESPHEDDEDEAVGL